MDIGKLEERAQQAGQKQMSLMKTAQSGAPNILEVADSLTTGSLETFHHLFRRAPLPLSSGEHGKHLHTRAMGSIADTSIPQGRGAWTSELA